MKYNEDKTPLNYQITEFDCGTATVLNAISYLYNRDRISPKSYKKIVQNTTDRNWLGQIGKGGSSNMAMVETCKYLKIFKEELKNEEVSINNKNLIKNIKEGAIAILQVYQENYRHYVLLTKLDDEYGYVFDPYYYPPTYYDKDKACQVIEDKPFEYNRKIKLQRFENKDRKDFALVKGDLGQIIILAKY